MNDTKNTSLTILITQVHSSYNAGDLALLDGLVRQLKQLCHEPRILILANWPTEPYFASRKDVEVIASPWSRIGEGTGQSVFLRIARLVVGVLLANIFARWGSLRWCPERWRDLFEAYRSSDVVIGVAGNQFYSTGRFGWPLPAAAFSVELAHLFQKPFYTMPQTMGPLKRGWERALMRRIYGRARQLFFREKRSIQLAQEIGIAPQKVQFAPDPAFGYPAAARQHAESVLSRYGYRQQEAAVGVTLIARMGHALDSEQMTRYYERMARFLERMIEKYNLRVYFFNQVYGPGELEDDRAAVKTVLSKMKTFQDRVIWVNEPLSPDLLKACYGLMDLFVASRLHSGIFSMGMHTPTIFIGYLTKTRSILETMDLVEWVVDLNEMDEEKLFQMGCQAWQKRDETAQVLANKLPAIQSSAQKTLPWVLEHLRASGKNSI